MFGRFTDFVKHPVVLSNPVVSSNTENEGDPFDIAKFCRKLNFEEAKLFILQVPLFFSR